MPPSAVAPRYLLGQDAPAADRLRVLDAVYGATSRSLLNRAGLRPGWQCADIGCGTGLVTLAMAERVGNSGRVVGVDRAEFFLNEARRSAAERGLSNIEFVSGDAVAPPLLTEQFDWVYGRCVLSHLRDPLRALQAMTRLTRPGGCVVIEDIDCGGVFAHPDAPALMRHLDLYQKVMRLHGCDPLMGRKLPRLCRQTGLCDVHFEIVTPTEPVEAVKRLYPMTLACLKPAIVEAALATADEVDALAAELQRLADDPHETMSSTPMVQVRARKP
ncbi:MAG: methyltransferase domain-containing protein [Verrucomicrobiae bacterium]|nr:methyltransferase domain-containing protein [Verrucomicrobiae bacterium]